MHTVLKNMTLIDGTGRVLQDAAMVFDGEVISDVGRTQEINLPEGAREYDLQGKYVMPGIIDAHIHLDMHGMADTYHESLVEDKLRSIRSGLEMGNTIRAGITTVRNAGSAHYIDIAVKKAVEEGLIVGPRILASGKIICMHAAGNEYFNGLYQEGSGIDENRRAAREQLKHGADFLKVMATGAIMNPGGVPGAPQLDTDEIRVVVEEGKKVGKHTAAHAHGAEGIKNSVRAGVRTVEHGTLADEQALKMMLDNNVYLTSTLSSNFWMLKTDNRNELPQFMADKANEVAKIRRENLHRAHSMGVKIIMGTDAGTPYNFHGKNAMEVIQFVKTGIMDEMSAIVASTRTAAEGIGLHKRVGTLEKGKLADCLVLRKDPLQDIEVLASLDEILLVFKGGEAVKGEVDVEQWSSASPLGPA
ncbi:MAG: amidohydrolase family protein [Desulfonatronovibrionaceae bacterium]